MDPSWIVDLYVAFEVSSYLSGSVSRLATPPGHVVFDGTPLGHDGQLRLNDFVALAADSGMRRLSLLCADGVSEDRYPRRTEHAFVVVGDSTGAWLLRNVSASTRWAYDSTTPPTSTQLDVAHAGWYLESVLERCRSHPVEFYRTAVAEALRTLRGGAFQEIAWVRLADVGEDAKRLLAAAMLIAGGKLIGMGGFTDAGQTIPTFDVLFAVTQAVAASTRA